jgi:transcriptional regulator with XRE-family HTH domain
LPYRLLGIYLLVFSNRQQREVNAFSYNLLVVLLLAWSYIDYVPDADRFFRRLGYRLRELRNERNWSLDDMELVGFSAKHWQQIESGRAITVKTLLRACESFNLSLEQVITSLDSGIYNLATTLELRQSFRRSAQKRRSPPRQDPGGQEPNK